AGGRRDRAGAPPRRTAGGPARAPGDIRLAGDPSAASRADTAPRGARRVAPPREAGTTARWEGRKTATRWDNAEAQPSTCEEKIVTSTAGAPGTGARALFTSRS